MGTVGSWRRGDGNCRRQEKRGWELWEVGEEEMGTVAGWRRGNRNCGRQEKRGWEL